MKILSKELFLSEAAQNLGEIHELITNLKELNIKSIIPSKTAFIIIDMVNGFVKEGALKSDRIEKLIPKICDFSLKCDELEITKIAFADAHFDSSPEFNSYPVHCLKESFESEIIDEIKKIGGYKLLLKNSTNGFLEEAFMDWLIENPGINNFIISGDCTDICIQQFAITLKAWFNKENKASNVIVPIDLVETYNLFEHNAEVVNAMALYNMLINGVDVVKKIVF